MQEVKFKPLSYFVAFNYFVTSLKFITKLVFTWSRIGLREHIHGWVWDLPSLPQSNSPEPYPTQEVLMLVSLIYLGMPYVWTSPIQTDFRRPPPPTLPLSLILKFSRSKIGLRILPSPFHRSGSINQEGWRDRNTKVKIVQFQHFSNWCRLGFIRFIKL